MSTTGVDVSNNNRGNFDLGAAFAMLKASEGTGYADTWFGHYRDLCDQHGIPWGGYHFIHADVTSPDAEAAKFVASSSTGALGWALDVEPRQGGNPLGTLGPTRLAAWCDRFYAIVTPQRGPGWFYCSRSWANELYPKLVQPWKWWLATLDGYPKAPTYLGRTIDIEQFAIIGGLDRNISYTGFGPPPPTQESVMPPSIGQLDNGELLILPGEGAKPWIAPAADLGLVKVLVFRAFDPDPAHRVPVPDPVPRISGANDAAARAWVASRNTGTPGGFTKLVGQLELVPE